MSHFDFKGQRANNLADPLFDKDAVNLRYAKRFIDKYSFKYSGGTLSNLTVTGDTVLNNLTATTIYSGGTDLYNIINSAVTGSTTPTSFLQNGLNTYTGGTNTYPTVNVSGLTIDNINVSGDSIFNNLNSTNLSGNTIYSGGTDLYNIINSAVTGSSTPSSFIQNGLNTYTGGTDIYPTVNISGLTIDNINVSGNSTFNELNTTTLSGGTIYSGSTDLYSIFQVLGSDLLPTYIQNGLNTYTGGTTSLPLINVSGLTIDNINVSGDSSFSSISASTIYSGSTNINDYFDIINNQLDTKSNLSGATFTGNINTPSLSATTISADTIYTHSLSGMSPIDINGVTVNSGGLLETNTITANTIYSGSTDLYNIINSAITGSSTPTFFIQNGLNTYTGGTTSLPLINVSGLTIDNINVSGDSVFLTLNSTNLSGGTIYSGSTNINNYFDTINSQLDTKSNISGQTFTGNIIAPNFSATTISADTIYSGSTNLYNIFQTTPTYLQSGLNTYTGGTNYLPTVNISGLTIDNINVSGNSVFTSTSASTLYVSNLSSLTEHIVTTTDGILTATTGVDVQFITDSTLISAIITETSWSGGTYTGIVTGSVEGQMYVGNKYLYLYQNSLFNRFNISRDNTTVVAGVTAYTQVATDNVIMTNITSANTVTLLASSIFTDFSLTLININTGTTTVIPNTADTISGNVTISLTQYDSSTLYTNGTNWYITSQYIAP